jgi:TPP-dependent pyruvate/acetoin dehydrogenase alpha subunit
VTLQDAVAKIREADAALQTRGPTPFPLPLGELAPVVAGSLRALTPGDWWVPSMRERVGAVLRGVPLDRLVDGKAGARPYKVAPPTGAPALRALIAVGLAQADRTKAALVHLGIGSAADGALHEALNLAALLRPNVLFVVSQHPLRGDAPVGKQVACSPADLAFSFGLGTRTVDGSDADAVHAAVSAARQAGGPHLILAKLNGSSPEGSK